MPARRPATAHTSTSAPGHMATKAWGQWIPRFLLPRLAKSSGGPTPFFVPGAGRLFGAYPFLQISACIGGPDLPPLLLAWDAGKGSCSMAKDPAYAQAALAATEAPLCSRPWNLWLAAAETCRAWQVHTDYLIQAVLDVARRDPGARILVVVNIRH